MFYFSFYFFFIYKIYIKSYSKIDSMDPFLGTLGGGLGAGMVLLLSTNVAGGGGIGFVVGTVGVSTLPCGSSLISARRCAEMHFLRVFDRASMPYPPSKTETMRPLQYFFATRMTSLVATK